MATFRLLSLPGIKSRSGLTPVRRRPAIDLSLTGLVYATLMLFMGVAAVNTQASLLFGVFGLMIGILLVSVSISRVTLKRVRVTRQLPEAAVVGQPLTITYRFENAKVFWPTISLTLSELDGVEGFTRQPTAYLLHAASGEVVSVPVSVVPKRRGVYTLRRFQVSTSFPFGFIKRAAERAPTDAGGVPVDPDAEPAGGTAEAAGGGDGDGGGGDAKRQRWWRQAVRHTADTLVVYPAVGRVDPRMLAQAQPADTTGATMRPRRGGSDELYGVKEYQPGESPRLIHWRRSARTGTLVTREMTQVSPPRLLLLVDTQRADDTRAGYAAVEEVIAMAASLVDTAMEQGLSIGAFAWAGPPAAAATPGGGNGAVVATPGAGDGWKGVAATRGKRQRRDLMTLLARLPANRDRGAAELVERCGDLLEPGTTAVLISPRPVEVGGTDRLRTGLVAVAVGSPQAKAWFRFPPGVAFDHCLPAEQESGVR